MGFIEDVTTYVWNWVVYYMAAGTDMICWGSGGWGLLFDDDDGALMQQCYDVVGNLQVTIPVMYESTYAEAS